MKEETKITCTILGGMLLCIWAIAMMVSFASGLVEQADGVRPYYRRIEVPVPGYLIGEWLTQKVMR